MIRMASTGELRLLENVSMWDRALANVMTRLKKATEPHGRTQHFRLIHLYLAHKDKLPSYRFARS